MRSFEELMKELSVASKQELFKFALSLYDREKYAPAGHKLTLNWAGGLAEYKDKFTSLGLQKTSLDWWQDTTGQ